MAIRHATIFTTALCNLNCKYCYICKDSAGGLKYIDNDIKRSFEENEFINSILSYGEDVENTLEGIGLWGGEPLLHLERFTNQIQEWFNAFPNLRSFDTSTNFALPNAIGQLEDLFAAINKYGPNNHYVFALQISIDGYEEMTDFGRGKNVTKNLLNNFYQLLNLKYNKNKIELKVSLKPTVSKETFVFLDSVEKCQKWFDFFNNEMWIPWDSAGRPFEFSLSLFNCALPTEWSKEDGYEFAKITKNLSQVDVSSLRGWDGYYSTIPMAHRIIMAKVENHSFKNPYCGGSCGAYTSSITPIPGNKFTVCHRGLFDNYVEYCNNTNNIDYMNGLSKDYFSAKDRDQWIFTLDRLKEMSHNMTPLDTCPHQIFYTDYMVFIKEYAKAGIIDEKYLNPKEIEATLAHYLDNSFCMQDGFIQSGTWTTIATYEIPLMYNGAMDIAIQETNKYMDKFGG